MRCLMQGNCKPLMLGAFFNNSPRTVHSSTLKKTDIILDQLKMTNSPPLCKIAILGCPRRGPIQQNGTACRAIRPRIVSQREPLPAPKPIRFGFLFKDVGFR
jgi:hypothetical protein